MYSIQRYIRLLAMGIGFSLLIGSVPAQIVQNGSVTGSPAANSGIQNGFAPPWTRCSFSPDLCNTTRPSFLTTSQVTPVPSPDGGTWLGVAALGECAETSITGLTIGQSYTLYFCGANFGTGSLYNGPMASPRITIGSSVQSFSIPQAASVWLSFSMNFTATATTMPLTVEHPSGSNAYASLDGFNLTGTLCSPVVLPASLSEFMAEARGCAVHLNWEVPSDYPATDFEVQRSVNGEKFEAMEMVRGNGPGLYRSVDPFPTESGYYRLRIAHEDGHVAWSEVRQVTCVCAEAVVEVSPNPAARDQAVTLHVFSPDPEVEIQVLGLDGSILYTDRWSVATGSWTKGSLPTESWAAGMYFVKTSLGTTTKLVLGQ